METGGKDYTITAVKRALDILLLFDREHPRLTLTEISQLSGIGKSSVLRILYTLCSQDFLYYSEDTRQYRIGAALYRLGSSADAQIDLRHIARKHLGRLAEETGMVCYLGTRQGDKMLYIEKVMPRSIPLWAQLTTKNEGTQELYSTGIGRLLLSKETDEEVERYLNRVKLEKHTDKTIVDKQRILDLVRDARKTHISGNRGENEAFTYSICAPVYDVHHEMVAAMSLCGLKEMIYNSNYEKNVQKVKDTALKISKEIGYLP